ncbi:MAG: phosphotransferase family protein [Nitrosomonadaceae bacterium]
MANILSINENDLVAHEADELCSLIPNISDKLKKAKYSDKCTIENKRFNCISSDKNVIYRVQGKYLWYLKFSLKEDWVTREIVGATSVKTTLADFSGYYHADVIRASLEDKYTLYSAIKGASFNKFILKSLLLGGGVLHNSSLMILNNIGRSIGRLHSYTDHAGLPVLSPSTSSYVQNHLSAIKQTDILKNKISEWTSAHIPIDEPVTWIHGNIKSEDLLITNRKVCFIDFGTCGSGSPYEDLINLCTYLVLFKTVPLFPWKLARKAMSAILSGYSHERNYDKNILAKYISMGIFRYYLKNHLEHNGFSSISGFPVSTARLKRLVLELLNSDYKNTLGWTCT